MPLKEKKLLRRFLVKCLDEGSLKSIRWVNKEMKTFQLLWLHANSPDWTEEDGALFKEWAIYKGRYKQLSDGTWPEDDYTNWKANFRCAVNRCHDIQEVKMHTGNKDLKTYKFIPRKHEDVWETYQPFPNTTWQDEGSDEKHIVVYTTTTSQGTTTQSYPPRMPENTDTYSTVAFITDTEAQYVPDVVQSFKVSPPTTMVDYDLQPVSPQQPDILQLMVNDFGLGGINDLLQVPSGAEIEKNVHAVMDLASLEAPGIDPRYITHTSLPDSLSMLRFVNAKPEMIDMIVWLRYREKVVGKQYIRCDKGCRIMNGDREERSEISERFRGCSLVGTPAPAVHLDRFIENTEQIIKVLGNGLHLFCDTDGNILATRLTSCRIFYADPTLKRAAEPQLLPRKQTVKVFDRNTFIEELAAWEKNKASGDRPSISILFGLGESWSLSKPINKCCVNLMVVLCYSWAQRMSVKEAENAQFEEEVEGTCNAMAYMAS